MHFEILVEDQSGKAALDILVPKVLGEDHTFRVIAYRGIGHIPPGLRGASASNQRILLDRLPQLLRGYGKTFAGYGRGNRAAVIVVCDLDDQCLKAFREKLAALLEQCLPQPETRFCLAIEEGEAWLPGDMTAVRTAYPKAKGEVLQGYVNDAVCGTWEKMADELHPGGARGLAGQGWQAVGAAKSRWAEAIAPHMQVDRNASPSFQYFRDKLQELAGGDGAG